MSSGNPIQPAAAASASRPLVTVVLAAGKGTRMRSERPKVLHEVGGEPMLAWVLAAAREAGAGRILAVIGHGAEEVRAAFAGADVEWVVQEVQRGTGDALARTASRLDGPAWLLVLSGDVPLVRPETLTALVESAGDGWGAMAVARLEDPGRLGRVVLDPDGYLSRIVEAADATEKELGIDLVNAGLYLLPAPEIFAYLERLDSDNAQGELYLTAALVAASAAGERVAVLRLEDADEALGINDRADLARVHAALLARRSSEPMAAGVAVQGADGRRAAGRGREE